MDLEASPGSPRDAGASAVEYAVLVSVIALVIVGAVFLLGGNLAELFGNDDLGTALTSG